MKYFLFIITIFKNLNLTKKLTLIFTIELFKAIKKLLLQK